MTQTRTWGTCLAALLGLPLLGCPGATPFYFNETAQVLRRGEVSVSAVGGPGGQVDQAKPGQSNPVVGGGGLRVRAGLGTSQEIGVDTLVAGLDSNGTKDVSASGKLAYKAGLAPPVALLLGLGLAYRRTDYGAPINADGTSIANSLSPGADLGLVVSPPRGLAGVLVPYLGLRTGLAAVFLGYDTPGFTVNKGTLGLFTPQAALGLAIIPARWLRLTLEFGYLGALYFGMQSSNPSYSYSNNLYGSAGLTFVFGAHP